MTRRARGRALLDQLRTDRARLSYLTGRGFTLGGPRWPIVIHHPPGRLDRTRP